MYESIAIHLDNVSKIYKLHASQRDQLVDVLGLKYFGVKTNGVTKEFHALSNISLDIPKGHRVGIIGRNGSGKTTLLKLICENFTPTEGKIEINGVVQALMNVGIGFHPEYTGRENVNASLQYNGLDRNDYPQALSEIIEFCELGDFLDQPFKTYSLGMQARLMFATATAIRPDILIVDEVLGAGDAYFVAKSKARVEKLVSLGCTMLLVSHSMQQVLELCSEVIWIDAGKIRMKGEAFKVVKAYEEFMNGPIKTIMLPDYENNDNKTLIKSIDKIETPASIVSDSFNMDKISSIFNPSALLEFKFTAPGGISRWNSEEGIKVVGFTIITEFGETNILTVLRPAKFVLTIIAEYDGEFNCCYGIIFDDHLGRCATRIFSPEDSFLLKKGDMRQVEILLDPCQLGAGEYTIGISVLENSPIETINSARRYDLLSRSFAIKVQLPDSLKALEGSFMHSAIWNFNSIKGT